MSKPIFAKRLSERFYIIKIARNPIKIKFKLDIKIKRKNILKAFIYETTRGIKLFEIWFFKGLW